MMIYCKHVVILGKDITQNHTICSAIFPAPPQSIVFLYFCDIIWDIGASHRKITMKINISGLLEICF